ncbi:MAG: ketopantoate reductase family protein [Methanocorpusculum sp.]|uniref:ketopantoate reductase family protein n=1 Tax=Methanocorpusculum sp. TaxID=2058474 RepID=UPI00271E83B3|nr:ketopantoate reductase family protein [Methanocorpusculum sp.]MDO9523161.1 ketopantoate reductase family protein [Methanocorpusculum sp.]
MRILLLGAGAVGLSIAAKLSKYAEVFAVCRERCSTSIEKDGFYLTGIWGTETFRFPCGTVPPKGSWDYIIISTKAAATREICEQYNHLFGEAEVVSLQNGIGNEEIIAEYTDHVLGAMIITGFEWKADNAVFVSVDGGETAFGRFPSGKDAKADCLAELFNKAGMRATSSENIRGTVWSKALYSCSLNPLGAIMECPYGELLREPAWTIITSIVHEAFEVARAEMVILTQKTADEYLEFLKTKKIPPTAAHFSSMYQDIAAGRKTEVDYINGAIVALGKRHNIPTQVNETIVNLTHFKEELSCR